MAFVHFHRSERVKLELYSAALVALIIFGFSPAWWIQVVLAVILSAIVAHLILSRAEVADLSRNVRSAVVAGAVAAVLAAIWIHAAPLRQSDRAQPVSSGSMSSARPNEPLRRANSTNQQIARDTARLVEELRDFQRRLDAWNVSTNDQLRLETKTNVATEAQSQLHIQHAKEFSAGMFKLDQEFNQELKPQVIEIRKQLTDRIPPAQLTPRPTVDWALKYGFATYPNAVGNIADQLEELARMLPQN